MLFYYKYGSAPVGHSGEWGMLNAIKHRIESFISRIWIFRNPKRSYEEKYFPDFARVFT